MKDLNPDTNLDTTIVIQKEVKSERKVVSLRPHKGHKCFEFNLEDQLMRLAQVSTVTSDLKGAVHTKIIMKPKCLYVTALNFQNADKKFAKMMKSYMDYDKEAINREA